MLRSQTTARLFLDGHDVGAVRVRGWDAAWGFGEFLPGEGFSSYAPRFGAWSLLMHADDDGDDTSDGRLSEAAAEELRRVEYDIDRIHAKLFLVGPKEWRKVSQLNIDGPLIEWKEDFSGEGVQGAA
jgi:hypothetical protein